jgi:hypothetical protein
LRPPTGEGDRSPPGDGEREADRGEIERIGDFEMSLRERDCDRVGERPRDALRERKGVGERESDGIVVDNVSDMMFGVCVQFSDSEAGMAV